jgi:hypothetical protein
MSIKPAAPAAPAALRCTRCGIPTPPGAVVQLSWYANALAADALVVKSTTGSPRAQLGMKEVHS